MVTVSGSSVGEVSLGDRSVGGTSVKGGCRGYSVHRVPDDSGCNVAGMHRLSSILLKGVAIFVSLFCVLVRINILTLSFVTSRSTLESICGKRKSLVIQSFSSQLH